MANRDQLTACGWHRCTETMAHQLTATTITPNRAFQCPTSALNDSLQAIAGLSAAYVSGYILPSETLPSLSATGEMIAVRVDASKIKTYQFVFAVTDDNEVYWKCLPKDIKWHHISLGSEVPIDAMFAHHNKGQESTAR